MDLLTYGLTVALLLMAPGPVTATLLVRAVGAELHCALAFAAGVVLSRALLLGLAMAGAAAWVARWPEAIEALRWAGAACLLVIAVRTWRAPPPRPVRRSGPVGTADLLTGVLLTVTSPYNPALYLTLLPALGWRIHAQPLQVAAATLAPTLLVCSALIALGRLGGGRLGGPARPALRRALAACLGLAAAWIALG